MKPLKTPRVKNRTELREEFKDEIEKLRQNVIERQRKEELPANSMYGKPLVAHFSVYPDLSYTEKASIIVRMELDIENDDWSIPVRTEDTRIEVDRQRLYTTKPAPKDYGCLYVIVALTVFIGAPILSSVLF